MPTNNCSFTNEVVPKWFSLNGLNDLETHLPFLKTLPATFEDIDDVIVWFNTGFSEHEHEHGHGHEKNISEYEYLPYSLIADVYHNVILKLVLIDESKSYDKLSIIFYSDGTKCFKHQ